MKHVRTSVFLWLALVLVLSWGTPAPVTAGALAWKEVQRKTVVRATTGRNRLDVTIVPTGNQSKATRDDLIATVKQAAERYQAETELPVVTVNMICQKAANAFGENQLAVVTYIPDGKGYDGKQVKGPWDTLMAAERGFTAQELKYLKLYAEMRKAHIKNGELDEEALDKAISRKMRVKPESVNPHYNYMQ